MKNELRYPHILGEYNFNVLSSCYDVRYDFRIKLMFGRLFLQLFVGGLMSYLRYLCLFAYVVVSNTYCVVFLSSSSVSYVASFFGLSIFNCPIGILKRLFK